MKLPLDIQVKQEASGVRYIFPKRDLSNARGFGIAILIFGLFVTGFMISWMGGPIWAFLKDEGGPMRWFLLAFGLMGTPGLVIGLGMLFASIAVLTNNTHSEILIGREFIRSTEHLGIVKWSWKRRLEGISDLVVSDGFLKTTGSSGNVSYPLGEHSSCLRVAGDDSKSLMVLPGYPKEIIKVFAEFLSHDVIPGKGGAFTDESNIEVREEAGDLDEIDEDYVVDQPEKSKTIYQKIDQGCTLTVPPPGIWKGSKGLMFFSVAWNGFMLFFTAMFVKGMTGDDAPPAGVFLFIGLFWVIGIAIGLVALNMGKRRALIAVVGGMLAIRRIGIFGTKEIKVSLEDLSSIRMGPSGMEVNDVPVMELQVFVKDQQKKKTGLLSQLENDELEWIAWVLRKATGARKSVELN